MPQLISKIYCLLKLLKIKMAFQNYGGVRSGYYISPFAVM